MRWRSVAILTVLASVALCATAVRIPSFNFIDQVQGEGANGVPLQLITRLATRSAVGAGGDEGGDQGKGKEKHWSVSVLVKYTVPPSEGGKFEEAWSKLAEAVDKEGKATVFALHKTYNDNLFYSSYAEWEHHEELHDHLTSDHFHDFAKFVDDHGIRWNLEWLRSVGEEEEKEDEDLQGHNVVGVDDMLKRHGGGRSSGDGDSDDWDKNIPEEYRHYIPKEYRPKHKKRGVEEAIDDDATADISEDTDEENRAHSKGHSKSKGKKGKGGDEQEEDPCWDKNIPKEYRHYIPKQYRPKHKKGECKKGSATGGGRRSELSATALATVNSLMKPNDQAIDALYRELMRGGGGGKKHCSRAHIIFTYFVPPGKGGEFEKKWSEAAKHTLDEEKGARIYGLRKVATDNTRYYGYGIWDSMRDYIDHLEADHTQKFLEWTNKENVVWIISPTKHWGSEGHRKKEDDDQPSGNDWVIA